MDTLKEVAKLINLSKATRICQNLQPVMREVRNKRGKTQLHYFCEKGMTSSVVRMLEMRSIDVEAKEGVYGWTCLMTAAWNGHLAICRLLIDKGAQVEAKDSGGWTPLHYAAFKATLRLFASCVIVEQMLRHAIIWMEAITLCSHWNGHISVVKELIEERNAEINARDDDGRTALRLARQ
jgi:ankyrin repeat protein